MKALEITTKIGCANFCKYCPQSQLIKIYSKRSKTFFLNFDNFSKILSKIPKEVNLIFSGFCEPFLNKECFKMIELASRKGYEISLNTTIMGMSVKDAETLKNLTIEDFCVHLPNKRKDENIIVDEKYIQILKILLKSKMDIKFVSFGEPNKKVEEILALEGIPKKKYVIELGNLNNRAGNLSISKALKIGKGPLICSEERLTKNVLLPNGDVVLCCMDYCLKHTLGNLLNQDYEDLFKGKEFVELKSKLKMGGEETLCKSCEKAIYSYSREFYRFKFNKEIYLIKRNIRKYMKRTTLGTSLLKLKRKIM